MEIKQLRYFIAVARHLNFTEASKQLFIAQSAVSLQISLLEKEIGVKLFVRNKRSVKLTGAGAVFLKEAIEAVNKTETAIQKARQSASRAAGRISIGFFYPDSSISMIMSKVLKRFYCQYPNIDYDLQLHNYEQIREIVNSGALDLGFTFSFGFKELDGISWEKIGSGHSCIAVHSEHALAKKTSANIALLAEEPFIVISRQKAPDVFDFFIKQCTDFGFSPRITNYASSLESALILVEAGFGVVMVPSYAKKYVNSNISFIDIEDHGSYDVGIIWQQNNSNPALSIFIKEVKNILSTIAIK